MFHVTLHPDNIVVNIYFRNADYFHEAMRYENDHVMIARKADQAYHNFKRTVEAIFDCKKAARKKKDAAEIELNRRINALK